MPDDPFDPNKLPDLPQSTYLSMTVMATLFAALLGALEDMLERQGGNSAREFCESLDRNMEGIYSQSKLVDSEATHQAHNGPLRDGKLFRFFVRSVRSFGGGRIISRVLHFGTTPCTLELRPK